jgi:ATP-dependent HslUV protease subunit HslV
MDALSVKGVPRNYTLRQSPWQASVFFAILIAGIGALSNLPNLPFRLFPLAPQFPHMKVRSTTILTVRHKGKVAIGGDGQVTLGTAVMKADAVKIRRLAEGKVICGFAGASADAFALLERFEAKLKDFPANVPRAATELAKEWRTDRVLRRLEALVAVVDAKHTLLVTGTGDVIQPTDGVLGIGSGGSYALAAARALVAHSSLSAAEIVRKALEIAAGIDIYTNTNIAVEELASET